MINTEKKILILGLGNFLLKDEGLGIHFADNISQEKDLPEYADVEDGATGGITLLYLMEDYKRVIVIDAMDFKGNPGDVKKVTFDEIKDNRNHLSVSLHGFNFFDVLNLAKTLSINLPEISIIGVQPADMTQGVELTPIVKNAYEKVKHLVFEEFNNYERTKTHSNH